MCGHAGRRQRSQHLSRGPRLPELLEWKTWISLLALKTLYVSRKKRKSKDEGDGKGSGDEIKDEDDNGAIRFTSSHRLAPAAAPSSPSPSSQLSGANGSNNGGQPLVPLLETDNYEKHPIPLRSAAEKAVLLQELVQEGGQMEILVARAKGWLLPAADLKLAGRAQEPGELPMSGERQVQEVFDQLCTHNAGRLGVEDIDVACHAMAEDEDWAEQQKEELEAWFFSERSNLDLEQFLGQVKKRVHERRLSFLERIYLAVDEPSSPPLAYYFSICIIALIYLAVDEPSSSIFAYCFSMWIMGLIIISSFTYVIMSVPSVRVVPVGCPMCEPIEPAWYYTQEVVCISFFTFEYVTRILCVPFVRPMVLSGFSMQYGMRLLSVRPPDPNPYSKRGACCKIMLWVVSAMNLIDLFAILPFYIDLILGDSPVNLAWLRIIRLARVFRIFKLGKYNESMQMFVRVLGRSMSALGILIFFLALEMIVVGSLIYFTEGGVWTPPSDLYPEGAYLRPNIAGVPEPSPFTSIPASFWWVIVTATTVGYGDVYPTTPGGKAVGVFTVLSGVLFEAAEEKRQQRLAHRKAHKKMQQKTKETRRTERTQSMQRLISPTPSEEATAMFFASSTPNLQAIRLTTPKANNDTVPLSPADFESSKNGAAFRSLSVGSNQSDINPFAALDTSGSGALSTSGHAKSQALLLAKQQLVKEAQSLLALVSKLPVEERKEFAVSFNRELIRVL
eukprot:g3821.t1